MRAIRYATNLVTAATFLVLNRLIALFAPVKPKKALFLSDVRAEIGGNLYYVYRGFEAFDPEIERVCFFKADRRNWSSPGKFLRMVYDMTTAGMIFLEDYYRYTSYFRVRDGQKICQLWHGAGAFKKFGYSRAEGNEHIRIHKGYRKYTHAIVSAEELRPYYAEAFGLPLSCVQATGVPRTDLFFSREYALEAKERIESAYPVLRDRKLILFAPTYRGLRADDAGYDFEKIPFRELYEALREDYVFAFKWHPALQNNLERGQVHMPDLSEYGDFFLDLSGEREINDLLLCADLLITDYSSVIFDYYLTREKILYYAYDLDTYYNGRSFYFDYEDYLYGPLVTEPEMLVPAIRAGAWQGEKRKRFGERFMAACDGRATEKTIGWVYWGWR